MDSGDTTKRMQVIFSGRVQGVGFRYTVCRIAQPFDVTGYVRNLPDGNVEVVAEGVEDVLLDFLNRIRSGLLGRYIVREKIHWAPASGHYNEFGISF